MKNNFQKIILFIALPGSIFCFLWFLGVIYIDFNPFYSFAQRLIILPQALISFGAVWFYRKWLKEKDFSFGQGLGIGLVTSIMVASISSILVYLYCQYYDSNLVTNHIVTLKEYLAINKAKLIDESSEAIYNGNFANVEKVNATSLAIDDFIWKLIRGTMFSILSSLALRRKLA